MDMDEPLLLGGRGDDPLGTTGTMDPDAAPSLSLGELPRPLPAPRRVRVAEQYPNPEDPTSLPPVQAFAKLAGHDWTYYIKTVTVVIGRSSEATAGAATAPDEAPVDVDLGPTKTVSRKHAAIVYNFETALWEIQIYGRNGIKIDGITFKPGVGGIPLRSGHMLEIGGVQFLFLLPTAEPEAEGGGGEEDMLMDDDGAMVQHYVDADEEAIAQALATVAAEEAQAQAEAAAAAAGRGRGKKGGATSSRKRAAPVTAGARARKRAKKTGDAGAAEPDAATGSDQHEGTAPPPKPKRKRPPRPTKKQKLLMEQEEQAAAAAAAAAAAVVQSLSMDLPDGESGPSPNMAAAEHQAALAALGFVAGFGAEMDMDQLLGDPQGTAMGEQQAVSADATVDGAEATTAKATKKARRRKPKAVGDPSAPGSEEGGLDPNLLTAAQPPVLELPPPPLFNEDGDLPDYMNRTHTLDYSLDDNKGKKPPYSYASLIAEAICSNPIRAMSLGEIYEYLSDRYSYFRYATHSWQNSIRHNLSLNRAFVKRSRPEAAPGKGCLWTIDPAKAHEIRDDSKKPKKRAAELFPPGPPSAAELAVAVAELNLPPPHHPLFGPPGMGAFGPGPFGAMGMMGPPPTMGIGIGMLMPPGGVPVPSVPIIPPPPPASSQLPDNPPAVPHGSGGMGQLGQQHSEQPRSSSPSISLPPPPALAPPPSTASMVASSAAPSMDMTMPMPMPMPMPMSMSMPPPSSSSQSLMPPPPSISQPMLAPLPPPPAPPGFDPTFMAPPPQPPPSFGLPPSTPSAFPFPPPGPPPLQPEPDVPLHAQKPIRSYYSLYHTTPDLTLLPTAAGLMRSMPKLFRDLHLLDAPPPAGDVLLGDLADTAAFPVLGDALALTKEQRGKTSAAREHVWQVNAMVALGAASGITRIAGGRAGQGGTQLALPVLPGQRARSGAAGPGASASPSTAVGKAVQVAFRRAARGGGRAGSPPGRTGLGAAAAQDGPAGQQQQHDQASASASADDAFFSPHNGAVSTSQGWGVVALHSDDVASHSVTHAASAAAAVTAASIVAMAPGAQFDVQLCALIPIALHHIMATMVPPAVTQVITALVANMLSAALTRVASGGLGGVSSGMRQIMDVGGREPEGAGERWIQVPTFEELPDVPVVDEESLGGDGDADGQGEEDGQAGRRYDDREAEEEEPFGTAASVQIPPRGHRGAAAGERSGSVSPSFSPRLASVGAPQSLTPPASSSTRVSSPPPLPSTDRASTGTSSRAPSPQQLNSNAPPTMSQLSLAQPAPARPTTSAPHPTTIATSSSILAPPSMPPFGPPPGISSYPVSMSPYSPFGGSPGFASFGLAGYYARTMAAQQLVMQGRVAPHGALVGPAAVPSASPPSTSTAPSSSLAAIAAAAAAAAGMGTSHMSMMMPPSMSGMMGPPPGMGTGLMPFAPGAPPVPHMMMPPPPPPGMGMMGPPPGMGMMGPPPGMGMMGPPPPVGVLPAQAGTAGMLRSVGQQQSEEQQQQQQQGGDK